MRNTPQSRKHLRRKLHQIQYETDDDLFEYARHFPHGNKVHRFGAGFEEWAEAEILFAHYAVSWLEANRYALPPAAASGRQKVLALQSEPVCQASTCAQA